MNTKKQDPRTKGAVAVLAASVLLLFIVWSLPLTATSANWIRVVVTDPSGNPLSNVEVTLSTLQDWNYILIDPYLREYTDRYGEATFRWDGENGAFPPGASFSGYVHCGGKIIDFSGATASGPNIVIKRVTCACADRFYCEGTTSTTKTTTQTTHQNPTSTSQNGQTTTSSSTTTTQPTYPRIGLSERTLALILLATMIGGYIYLSRPKKNNKKTR